MGVLMRRLFFFSLLLCSCRQQPDKNPYVLDTRVTMNTTAFEEASRHIILNIDQYYSEKDMRPQLKDFLAAKSLTIYDYSYYIHMDTDTTIKFENDSYILRNDTLYKFYVLYNRKHLKEIVPSQEDNYLRKKIDTNLYYVIYHDYSP